MSSHKSGAKHVTVLSSITIDKGDGCKMYYEPGLALVAPELAESWIKAGLAEPYPKPVEETPAPIEITNPDGQE